MNGQSAAGQAWTICNRKGGVAKTTTTVALGELIGRIRPDLRPVVIDLDSQGDDGTGDATTWAALAEAAGDPLIVPVVEPPETITPVRLPGWVRAEYSDRLVLIDCPPAAGGSPEQEAAVEIVAERGGVVVIPTSPEVIDAVSTAATLRGVTAPVDAAVLLVKTEANTIRTNAIRSELTEVLNDTEQPLDMRARILDANVPKRAEVAREILAPIAPTSLLLNLYKPVVDELLEGRRHG